MGLFDFTQLLGEELRNWLNTSGQAWLMSFENASQALNFFREEGGHIRTADFYNIYNGVHDRYEQTQQASGWESNELVPLADTITDHGWNLNSDFLYRVEVVGFNPENNELVTRYVSVASNKQLSPDEILAYAGDMLEGEEAVYGVADYSLSVSGAYGRPQVKQ